MGYFLEEHDIYVGSLLDEFNVRFAPSQGKATHYGGIEEMAALQKEFKIFKKGRSFKSSIAVLNIGAFNNEVKTRWHAYLDDLQAYGSNKGASNGDAALVNALMRNLASTAPLPVHFMSHDLREDKRVIITDKARPLFYMTTDYMTVSLPMQPAAAGRAAAAKKKSRS